MNTANNTGNKTGAAPLANTAKCNLAIGLFGLKTAKRDEQALKGNPLSQLDDQAA